MSSRAKEIRKALSEFEKKRKIGRGKSMVVGGAALHLHGLRPEVEDLDVVHPDLPSFERGPYGNFEVDAGPGGHLSEHSLRSERLHGVQTQTLSSLLDFYQNAPRMNRPKDQVWIELLKKKIAERG